MQRGTNWYFRITVAGIRNVVARLIGDWQTGIVTGEGVADFCDWRACIVRRHSYFHGDR